MKRNRYFLFGFSCLAALSSCSDDETFVPAYEPPVEIDSTLTVTVNAAELYQTIDGFGASDAWMMDPIGKHWSEENREGIAKLLFSRERDNLNNPEGI